MMASPGSSSGKFLGVKHNRLYRTFADAIRWIGLWAFACAAIFVLRFGKIWNLVGGTWSGLTLAFLALLFGGAVLYFAFSKLDRIRTEGLKFLSQMFLCLLFAIAVGAVLLVLSL
ncbi:MAG TPA: hypothetical protein DDZ51_10995 [Planctomycetaceae bacterium]|nr:hypothetical protein [Planctomycetaceae bacterium]